MKKILVPCDFSAPSLQAYKLAAELARAHKGVVYLINVVELPVLSNTIFSPVRAYELSYLRKLKEKAARNFEKMKKKWGGRVSGELLVVQGPVAATIQRFAERKKIDLIVMGTHGTSGIREYAVGSNTEKIVRTSKVPVIVVKTAPRKASFEDIIMPTDLQPDHRKLIASVKALQKNFKARLHLLYVNTPVNFTRDVLTLRRLEEFARQHHLKNYTVNIFNDRDEEDGIIHFSTRFKSKIIAMGTHGRRGLGHLLAGSIAEDVVNHVNCPIWTCSEK